MVEALLLLACTFPDSGNPKPTETDTGTPTTTDSSDTEPCPESADSGTDGPEELLLEETTAAKILGESPSDGGNGYRDYFRAAGAGDVDGDGHQDLVVGCASCDIGESFGKAWLLLGPFSGTNSVTAARAEFYNTENSSLGYTVASAGDTTGDGTDDLLLSEKFYQDEPDRSGRVLLVTEPPSGSVEAVTTASASFVSAYVSWSGSGAGEEVGGGNFDGDGHRDVFMSPSYSRRRAGSGPG